MFAHRVHLKAVGSLGESCNSDVVVFRTSAVSTVVSASQSDDPNNARDKSGMAHVIGSWFCMYQKTVYVAPLRRLSEALRVLLNMHCHEH